MTDEQRKDGTVAKGWEENNFSSIEINRPPYTRSMFDIYGAYNKPERTVGERIKESIKRNCRVSARCCLYKMISFLPFLKILSTYTLPDFLNDVISGLTVGIMHIPQGMAYGMLANIDPVYGLYTSFFPVIVYFFLGTSRHISIGTFAVVSLMLGAVVNRSNCDSEFENETLFNGNFSNFSSPSLSLSTPSSSLSSPSSPSLSSPPVNYEAERCKLETIVSVTFLVGIIQIVLAICRFGIIATYLSSSLTRALTTGAAVHIFTSQIKHVFAVRTGRFEGPLKLGYTYKRFFERIGRTNPAAVVMSLICCVLLYCSQRWISPKVKPYIKMPLPSELLMLIAGTTISYFFKFSSPDVFNMKVVGHIPQGFPPPQLPNFSIMPGKFVDATTIGLVSFIISISMAKLFSNLQKYEVDSNQELLAYGVTNIVCAPLNCYVSTASLSRSYVQYVAGGKTQVAGLISCLLLLVVILVVGPLFRELPNCVLASIIIVNLKGIFLQVLDLKYLTKVSKYDAIVWIVTCLAVILSDVDLGLMAGFIVALFSVLWRTKPKLRNLGNIQGTECYQDMDEFLNAKEVDGIKIVSFAAPLYYANSGYFSEKMQGLIETPKKVVPCLPNKNSVNFETSEVKDSGLPPYANLIIDCGLMSFIDVDGISALNQVASDYKALKVSVCLAACNENVYINLKKSMKMEKLMNIDIFITIHDAVVAIIKDRSVKRVL